MGQRVPLRILLTEDNATNQKLALHLLKRLGYRADVAANGIEVLDALRQRPYDVIFMDVQMPEMDGLEATRRIRRNDLIDPRHLTGPISQPRVIAMTANAMQGDRETCLEAGMDDYISKPIRVEELVAALQACQPEKPQVVSSQQSAEAAFPSKRETIEMKFTNQQPSIVDRSALDKLMELAGDADFFCGVD